MLGSLPVRSHGDAPPSVSGYMRENDGYLSLTSAAVISGNKRSYFRRTTHGNRYRSAGANAFTRDRCIYYLFNVRPGKRLNEKLITLSAAKRLLNASYTFDIKYQYQSVRDARTERV